MHLHDEWKKIYWKWRMSVDVPKRPSALVYSVDTFSLLYHMKALN